MSASVRRRGHVMDPGSNPVPVDDHHCRGDSGLIGPLIFERPAAADLQVAATRERPSDERHVDAYVVQTVGDHPQVPPGVRRHGIVGGRRHARGHQIGGRYAIVVRGPLQSGAPYVVVADTATARLSLRRRR